MNETSQAIAHCTKITKAAYRLPNSLLTVATAATQGVYNKQNIKNTNAVNFENKTGSFVTSPPSKTVKVLTTLSFAINPVMNAVEILQSENDSKSLCHKTFCLVINQSVNIFEPRHSIIW